MIARSGDKKDMIVIPLLRIQNPIPWFDDIRFVMNMENILNLRNVFLENKVWKVWHESGKLFGGS